ncbi:MAG TPA: hypothetical protein VNE39_14425 [Planctomycetota bacterium]|nr:hypothetical protein [Planctomycetota bacterium]
MSHLRAEKAFDCLEYKDRVQREIYEEIRGLTHEEQIAYFNRSAERGPVAKWWRAIRRTSPPAPTAAAQTR